jgi:excisionase family DNA binding protein
MEVPMSRITIDDTEENGYYSAEGDILTLNEVCGLLKVPKSYIYSLTHQRKIPHIKMMGHLRFRRSEIDDWLAEQEVRSADT